MKTNSMKTVTEKLGMKQGQRVIFIAKPEDVLPEADLPEVRLSDVLNGLFDYIHLFAEKADVLNKKFPILKKHLQPTGSLWVSWQKNGNKGTDLTLAAIIKTGYDYGLVESKTLSINATWSAIKFTFPKKGKLYNNSYGQLKEQV